MTFSNYWKLVKLDGTGKCKVELIPSAKAFFGDFFPELPANQEISDGGIQKQLWAVRQSAIAADDLNSGTLADLCLRCWISSQIYQFCGQLAAKFGQEYGFKRDDLLPLVLDDFGELRDINLANHQKSPQTYQSFSGQVLQSFDPNRGNLANWVISLLKSHPPVNQFLLERGVYLISNWAILNDTTVKQLQRVLRDFHHRSAQEIAEFSQILESYHGVYRAQRRRDRAGKTRGKCLPPTLEQLQEMATHLPASLKRSPQRILSDLQNMAGLLREYRIFVRTGTLRTHSLDHEEMHANSAAIAFSNSPDDPPEENEFLSFYRQQFILSLDAALEHVTRDRLAALQRKKNHQDQQFLLGLYLFHCQGKAMTDIAPSIGLQAQYQVTRLLQLKSFRADVRQRMLLALQGNILEKAKFYADPELLKSLDEQIEVALNEQISSIIQAAEAEASISKNRPTKSLFTQRLCRNLKNYNLRLNCCQN